MLVSHSLLFSTRSETCSDTNNRTNSAQATENFSPDRRPRLTPRVSSAPFGRQNPANRVVPVRPRPASFPPVYDDGPTRRLLPAPCVLAAGVRQIADQRSALGPALPGNLNARAREPYRLFFARGQIGGSVYLCVCACATACLSATGCPPAGCSCECLRQRFGSTLHQDGVL